MTRSPISRAAASTDPIGITARASLETSLPSTSPKPPGSMKSRCMSMMTSAVFDQSRSIGSGSAMTVPFEACRQFKAMRAPRSELFAFLQASGMPLCTTPIACVAFGNPASFQRVRPQASSCSSVRRACPTSVCLLDEHQSEETWPETTIRACKQSCHRSRDIDIDGACFSLPSRSDPSAANKTFGSNAMTLMQVGLDDKYRFEAKRIYLSGVQALVRLPMLQRERDRAAGLITAGFISGYRGSPLGMYDHTLWRAKSFLQAHDIAFVPGLNEDLAATAVWGSQQVGLFPGAKVDGVFGIWYGKGPGVDRSVDVLKHANSAGSSRHGGVLALAGDDHGCQSSTLAHQSEQVFAAALMPIINPATLQDYLDL